VIWSFNERCAIGKNISARLRLTQDAHDEINFFLREAVPGIAREPTFLFKLCR